MALVDDGGIDALILDVVAASKMPAKTRATNVRPVVTNLTSLAYESGLLPSSLSDLVDLVVTTSHLDQASLAAIVRNLYPASKVSRDVTFRVLGALGHGQLKPSLNLQAALLKWLIMVHHVLENQSVLSQAYSVLFNLLDTAAIRPQLCHLLALITRRKHVRPFRIQALMELSRQTGNDPPLVGLLRVYKDYYPEIIVGEAVRGKASAFKHPDPLWRDRLSEIQDAHLHHMEELSATSRSGFRVNRSFNRTLRRKILPVVHTSHATEDSVTLEEVEDVASFVRNMDKIELPNQLVAVLADPLLQKLLLLRPNSEAYQRIANWLNSVLQDVIDGDADDLTLWEVLDVVSDFVTQTKSLPPIMLDFFARFLKIWDGSGQRETIFQMLSFIPLLDFRDLYPEVFRPLETAVLDNTAESQVALLTMYTNILHNWTAVMQSMSLVPIHATAGIKALVSHVGRLALTLLQTSPTVSIDSIILTFYEQTASLVTDEKLKHHVPIELPPSVVIYTLLFDSSLTAVSRLCNILACYKKSFEGAISNKTRHDSSPTVDARTYDRAYVNVFNGYLMDICNCFWRARAFSDTDTNAHGCLMPRLTVSRLTSYVASVDKSTSLTSMFSLSHSPVLCLQSIQRVRELEDEAAEKDSTIRTRHAGPVTQNSLIKLGDSGGLRLTWQEYRIDILKTLDAKSLGGIGNLLKNTMTVLKHSMDGKPATKERTTP